MSQVIDTKVVEMQFDNSKFEKNIQTSLNSLKFLNKTVEDAGKNRNSLDGLAKAGDQVSRSFENMNMKSRISFNMMDMLAGVGTKAFNRISDAVAGFTMNLANSLSGMQAMRDGFAEYELKMGSVQTMLVGAKIIDPSTLKATTDEARRLEIINDELEKLNAYSDKTIYSFKDMTSNIGKFTNNGVELHDAVQAIQGVANVAAAAGANSSEASRAMYNFSQALSSGAVKLIDWKSIENANMATQDFKQQLLDTAQALGTVTKNGNEYVSTTKDLQGKISDAFTKTKGFNDSLSHQWMTTEVLTQTLKNYSTDVRDMSDIALDKYKKSLLELGYTSKQVNRIIENSRKAFEAATEVKTFSQMIDTLKESLGSGWAKTWEIVIGDFNEAKKLFTDLNNTIDGLLSPIGNARNAILQMWKDNGGRDAMIKAFANLYHAIQNLFDPIKQLWKALTPNTSTAGKALATISKAFEKFTGVIRRASKVIAKVLSGLLLPFALLGRFVGNILTKLIGLIRSGFSKILKFIEPVSDAFTKFGKTISDIFNKQFVSRINDAYKSIVNFFDGLKSRIKSSSSVQKLIASFSELREIINNLFSRVLQNASNYAVHFISYLRRLWMAITPLVSSVIINPLKSLGSMILPKLGRILESVTNKIKSFGNILKNLNIKNSGFYKALSSLPEKISGLAKNKTFKTIATEIKNFGSEALTFLTGKFEALKASLGSIKMPNGLKDVFENVKNFIKSIFGEDSVKDKLSETMDKAVASTGEISGEKSGEKLTLFQKFLSGITDAFNFFRTAAEKATKALGDFIGFIVANTPKAFTAIHNFLAGDDGILTLTDFADIFYVISEALGNLSLKFGIGAFGKGAGAALSGITDSVGDLTMAVTDFLKKTSNSMKMNAVKNLAIAIGILAGSVYLLSKVPWQKLVLATSVIIALGYALSKFFDIISSGNMDISKTAGNLSIGAMLLAFGAAMVGVAASIGVLVGALAIFPKVIKQYNNLGEDFRTGMDRVKEVLAEIFEYINSSMNGKYSLRVAGSLLGLVMALSQMQKVITKFASKKMGKAMADGLSRIQEVMDILAGFFNSISLASFSFINIGIDFDMLGMAAMIWALGGMIQKIQPAITEMAKLSPSEFKTGFGAFTIIMAELALFLGGLGALNKIQIGASFGEWIGMAANIAILASAISTVVSSLKTITELVGKDEANFDKALSALRGIFIELGAVLAVVGIFEPKAATGTLFGLSLCIGVLTACVVALVPLANHHPDALRGSVVALGALMLALGATMWLTSQAANKTSIGDIVKMIAVVGAMTVLTMAIRRLAKSGASEGSIVAAGFAIGGAAIAIAGAMGILAAIPAIPLSVLAGLALLTAAIWGVVYAIRAFKDTPSDMATASENVSNSAKEMEEAVGDSTNNMATLAKDALPQVFKDLGDSIANTLKETFGNIDLGEAIRNAINAVKADAKNWGQDFIDVGTNIVNGISTAISNPANVEKVKSAIKGLGQALLDSFKLFFGIASPSTVMQAQGGFIIDGLVQGLMDFPSKLAGWAEAIGTFIKEGISGLVESGIEKGKSFVNSLGQGIQNGKEAVAKKASALGKAAVDKVGRAKEWAQKATASANSYGARLRASKNPIAKAAGMMIVGATNHVQKTASIFSKASSAASAKFSSELNKGKGPAKSAAAAIVTGAKSAFNSISSSFRSYGVSAAQGFRNGINSLIASVAAKAAEMVRRAKAAAKAEQNSNSPSKDFMEFGGWAAEGYAIGMTNRKSSSLIESNAKKMVDSAKNIAASTSFGVSPLDLDSNPALRSLAYTMGVISDSLDNSIDSNPRIRPVIDMSNVDHNSSIIDAMFGDKKFNANVNAAFAQNGFDQTMAKKQAMMSMQSIDKLSKKIDSMTETMNSRSLNIYNTIDGASDPEAFADGLLQSFKLNARTV